ncbi:MAG: thioredoxin domain-containing protein [Candidatus Paceibacterota bacterium]|jgi:protein-disulfide isomerase
MEEKRSSLAIPIAVIICILILIGAFYYQSQNPRQPTEQLGTLPTGISELLPIAEGVNLSQFRPVDNTDHLRGSATAPIKVVVYTDLECPACKYFHTELRKLDTAYVATGKVAIVIRDFPLDSLHAKSRNEFLAAECVNEIGGNEKFWQFVDQIFEITSSNDGLDPAKLDETAKNLAIDTKDFEACMTAKKYANKIQESVDEAMALGAQGTPFFVLVTPDQNIPVFGGLPAERLAAAFDLLLNPTPAESPVLPTASTTAN